MKFLRTLKRVLGVMARGVPPGFPLLLLASTHMAALAVGYPLQSLAGVQTLQLIAYIGLLGALSMKFLQVISGLKADWSNHLIGFISTVIGIIIAFQLQDWQEKRTESEKLKSAIESIKQEIKDNKEILNKSIKTLEYFTGYSGFIENHSRTDSTIVCTVAEWDSIKNAISNHEDYGSDLKSAAYEMFLEKRILKKLPSNRIEVIYEVPISFFVQRIRTDSWEAVKASGLLSSFPYDKLKTLTRLYSELVRNNTGVTPDDFMITGRRYKSIKQINQVANDIAFDYRVKTWRIDDSFDEIMKY